ncbi:peptidase [Pilimelia terevasa]|uniref:Peptidase n=1 Tax=Pilimelia terevasa TaxID=53372 RepID=A0A8J3BT42_9ACTN|nr:prolyl oligopeptidase family serine peptidase [Pilimelia terevasa]GGK36420.1 peptidase [Pilimelia terevasa]
MTLQPAQPLDARVVASDRTTLDHLVHAGGGFYWLEAGGRSGGEAVVVRAEPGHVPAVVSVPGVEIASGLHSYGGGAYAIAGDGALWFTTTDKAALYRRGHRELVEVGIGVIGDLVADGDAVLGVREDADGDALVQVGPDGRTVELMRATAHLSSPTRSGQRIAWLQWDDEHMPWDRCGLWVGQIGPDGNLVDAQLVAGLPEEAAAQPRWAPDGTLYFASDRAGWWNLYRWDGHRVARLTDTAGEQAVAHWEHGYRTFDLLPDGRIVVITQRGASQRLEVVSPTGRTEVVPLPYSSIKPYLAVGDGAVGIIAATPVTSPAAVLVNIDTPTTTPLSTPAHEPLDGSAPVRSEPLVVGGICATLYRAGPRDAPLPTIVRAHPGPTYNMQVRVDAHIRYFTSHGFAVVDVDYRGSTGYGRAFRQSLYGHWGCYDVEDCTAVARWLIKEGYARGDATFIAGASAGGYTAMRCVSRNDSPFAGAVASSAIADPQRWTTTVPRFQRAHAKALAIGAEPVAADTIARPVLLLHGTRDAVAPIDDVRPLAAALRGRSGEHQLVELDAGHGLTAPATLVTALEAEHAFYGRRLGSPVG